MCDDGTPSLSPSPPSPVLCTRGDDLPISGLINAIIALFWEFGGMSLTPFNFEVGVPKSPRLFSSAVGFGLGSSWDGVLAGGSYGLGGLRSGVGIVFSSASSSTQGAGGRGGLRYPCWTATTTLRFVRVGYSFSFFSLLATDDSDNDDRRHDALLATLLPMCAMATSQGDQSDILGRMWVACFLGMWEVVVCASSSSGNMCPLHSFFRPFVFRLQIHAFSRLGLFIFLSFFLSSNHPSVVIHHRHHQHHHLFLPSISIPSRLSSLVYHLSFVHYPLPQYPPPSIPIPSFNTKSRF
ncbi:hypothetical protein CPC08DRAFT_124524 [Agrocybe pediades]|nr:hypothetical protein CPC08DRAFT_124524 [Agrocybe pediades]